MNEEHSEETSGSALIVAIAVLFVMVILAVALLNISSSERASSSAYVDKVRARMLAMSGIERVLASKQNLGTEEASYLGENWNADDPAQNTSVTGPVVNASGSATGSEMSNGNNNGRLDTDAASPRYALNPSFASTTSTGGSTRPKLVQMKDEGRTVYRGFTGRLPSSYSGRGMDTYTVKAQSIKGININSLNPYIGEVINNLCNEVSGCPDGSEPGTAIVGKFSDDGMPDVRIRHQDVDNDGIQERVIQTLNGARPDVVFHPREQKVTGGFSSVRALLNKGVLTSAQFAALQNHLVTQKNVFVDMSVIRPKPQNTDLTFDESGWSSAPPTPYSADRDNDGDGSLLDAYPLPDRTPGEPKAIRGAADDSSNRSTMTHTELIRWVDNPGGPGAGDLPDDLSEDAPYGAFRYNFDYKLQPRVPVNINSASTATMKSVMTGIRARVLEITERPVYDLSTFLPEAGKEGGSANGFSDNIIEKRYFNPMYQTRVIPQEFPTKKKRPLKCQSRYTSPYRTIWPEKGARGNFLACI